MHNLDPGPEPIDAPPLKWGILAAGGIARTFAETVPAHSRSTVVAVGSRSPQRAQAFADEFAIPRSYGDYGELVADPDVEAVYIASPHSEHRNHALLAINAGKHVLLEKCFAETAPQAQEIFDAARARGVFVMEAMWTRFLPQMVALRQLLAQQVIGDIVTVSAHHGQALAHVPRMARPDLGGGALLDLGIYPIAFAFDILGTPSTIAASGWLTELGADAAVAATFSYPGALAQVSTTMLARSHNVAEIAGTRGRITVSEPFYAAAATLTVHPRGGEPWTFAPTVTGGFQFQVAEVARRVREGALESPLRSWAETIATQVVIDEIRRQILLPVT
ncbi:MAG: Gfo/Idh/MocA family protein [Beutenbergiaceae bacterium]